jgi:hypothetical protein
MARKTPPSHVVKLVWRITDEAPMGTYVDANAPKPERCSKGPVEVFSGGWVDSSFDLLHGGDVTDDPDTITPEQLDELFGDGEEWPSTRPSSY